MVGMHLGLQLLFGVSPSQEQGCGTGAPSESNTPSIRSWVFL